MVSGYGAQFIDFLELDKCDIMFQQDDAMVYTAKVIMNMLKGFWRPANCQGFVVITKPRLRFSQLFLVWIDERQCFPGRPHLD